MKRLVHRGWVRNRIGVSTTAMYVLVALSLGIFGEHVGGRLIGQSVSAISSASAIAILASMASGMMALTAIVFSFVFVAIQIGTTSYSPRLVLVLGRSPAMAHALGIFIGTFLYALLAIRTVDVVGGPGINTRVVFFAFLWLLASIIAIVVLVPRIRSLSIAEVLSTLYRHGAAAAERVYRPRQAATARALELPVTQIIRYTGRPAYLVGFDAQRLVRLATRAGALVEISPAIGDAINDGDRLAVVRGGTLYERSIRHALWFAPHRLLDNDPAYSIRLLVDIAIRALSPAVNDPTTAVSVLDQLDGLLRKLGRMPLEDNLYTDDDGRARLIRTMPSWNDLVTLALTEIQQYGRDSFQVERRFASMLRDLLAALPEHRRGTLRRFDGFRAVTATETVQQASAWSDAPAGDKQGLGHRLSISPGSPSRPVSIA